MFEGTHVFEQIFLKGQILHIVEARGQGSMTRGQGAGTRNQGLGTRDHGPGTSPLAPPLQSVTPGIVRQVC